MVLGVGTYLAAGVKVGRYSYRGCGFGVASSFELLLGLFPFLDFTFWVVEIPIWLEII